MAYEQLFGLFPDPCVHVSTCAVSDAAIASMSGREAATMVSVVNKRRREFATARALAREGFERFYGLRNFDLLNGEDRAPIWPPGITGSISHSSTRAWVALVDAARGTIGIDGENRDRLERDLWHLTMCDEEIAYLDELQPSVQERRALLIFSAKEALYKAQYPWSREHVDFMAVRIKLNEDGNLQCIFQKNIDPFQCGFIANGRWLDKSEVVTTVCIPSLSSVA